MREQRGKLHEWKYNHSEEKMNEGKVYRGWDLQDHSITGDVKWFLTWICTCGLENKVKERLKMTAICFQITLDSLTFFSSFEVQLIPSLKGNRSLYTLELSGWFIQGY